MNKYKAIFFDWDGTAVESRNAPVDAVVPKMEKLLEQGVKLFIISGTTYENIAGGRLCELIDGKCRQNLYLGLGRGAYNYKLCEEPVILHNTVPDKETVLKIHQLSFQIHSWLFQEYNYPTDIVFSRPNYCKIDLLVSHDRKEQLFLQEGELDQLNDALAACGCLGGIKSIIEYGAEQGSRFQPTPKITTDAKYLEVGITTKSDNVDYFLQNIVFPADIDISECCFLGDEFTYLGDGISGSDGLMITSLSEGGSFFDVSKNPPRLPQNVAPLGGGVQRFLEFLENGR